MGLQDRMVEFATAEEVDAFLKEHPTAALFKAGGCHKTMQGFGYVAQALEHRDIHLGVVRVIDNRPASNHIAELTGIKHESPQLILVKDGEPVYDVDNWAINLEELEAILTEHLGATETSGLSDVPANVTPYLTLLRSYLQGDLPEEDFEMQWLETFQADASLRSTRQFALLNSLYGDVDEALNSKMVSAKGPLAIGGGSHGHNSVRCRAQRILTALEQFVT